MPSEAIEPPFDSLPTLAELVDDLEDARALWHKARQAADRAERDYREAVRRMVTAEGIFRTAAERYEQERRQALT